MTSLLAAVRVSLRVVCPSAGDARRLVALLLIGTAIPLCEMLLASHFSSLVTGGPAVSPGFWWQAAVFFLLFLAIRAAHYAQRTYRVTYLDRALPRTVPAAARTESWQWALGIEVIGILAAGAQLAVLACLFFVVSPMFGAISLLVLLSVLEVVGRLFVRQTAHQKSFRAAARERVDVPPGHKVRTRVVAAELGSLASAVGAAVQLAALIALFAGTHVDVAATIVLFFGVRLQTTVVSALSGSAMRLARARAQVAA